MSFLEGVRRDLRFFATVLPLALTARKAGPDRTVDFSDLLEPHFRSRADRPVLIGESGSLTWRELDLFANRIANWALAEGLGRGDVVGLLMENRPEFIGIWLGLSRIGVVSALLNTNLTGDRLAHCMREADARHCIVGVELAESAASALPELTDPPVLLVAGSAPAPVDTIDAIPPVLRDAPGGAKPFDSLYAHQSIAPVPEAARAGRRGGDPLFYIYTSGTRCG